MERRQVGTPWRGGRGGGQINPPPPPPPPNTHNKHETSFSPYPGPLLLKVIFFSPFFKIGPAVTFVSQWLERQTSEPSDFWPKDPGFGLLAGRGAGHFFCLFGSTCEDLFVPDPLSCARHAPRFVCTLKIPYPSVVKEWTSQPVVWSHTKILHTPGETPEDGMWLPKRYVTAHEKTRLIGHFWENEVFGSICFKGNIGETPETRSGAHMCLPECIDTILSWTELINLKTAEKNRKQNCISSNRFYFIAIWHIRFQQEIICALCKIANCVLSLVFSCSVA